MFISVFGDNLGIPGFVSKSASSQARNQRGANASREIFKNVCIC